MYKKLVPNKILVQKEVKSSSSDNVYMVTIYDNCISCTCPAGGRKTLCKHLITLIHENMEVIKNENSEFFEKLMQLVNAKNESMSLEEKKKLADEVIFVNKDIAQNAYLNNAVFEHKKEEKKELVQELVAAIDKIDIHHQFSFFELIPYNNTNSDMIFSEKMLPEELKAFFDLGYLIEVPRPKHRKKDAFYFTFSLEIKTYLRALYKALSPRFPIIEEFDEDGLFFTTKRIIANEYLQMEK